VKIGQYLRERYWWFYPKNPKNGILRSNTVDRCIDSLALISGQLWPSDGRPDFIQPRIFKVTQPLDGVIVSIIFDRFDLKHKF
jgi:hypothetical protein